MGSSLGTRDDASTAQSFVTGEASSDAASSSQDDGRSLKSKKKRKDKKQAEEGRENQKTMYNADHSSHNVQADTAIICQPVGDTSLNAVTDISYRKIEKQMCSIMKRYNVDIADICHFVKDQYNVEIIPQSWNQILEVMREKKIIELESVVILQVMLWKIGATGAFQAISEKAREIKKSYNLNIAFLTTDPKETKRKEVKFHLALPYSKYSEKDLEKWRSHVALIMDIPLDHVSIKDVCSGSMVIIVIMPAIVSEALKHRCKEQRLLKALWDLRVCEIIIVNDDVEETILIPPPDSPTASEDKRLETEDLERFDAYYGRKGEIYGFRESRATITSSSEDTGYEEPDVDISLDAQERTTKMARRSNKVTNQEEEIEVEEASLSDVRYSTKLRSAAAWVKKRILDIFWKRQKRFASDQEPKESTSVTKIDRRHNLLLPHSILNSVDSGYGDEIDVEPSPSPYTKNKEAARRTTKEAHVGCILKKAEEQKSEMTEARIETPMSSDACPRGLANKGKSNGERIPSREAHTEQIEEAKLAIMKGIKAGLEEIKSPEDPPAFLLSNRRIGKTRNVATDILVLHPKLGVLALQVKLAKSFLESNEIPLQFFHSQKHIQEEMRDLLEEKSITMAVVLPNLNQRDADTIKNIQEKKLKSHQEFRPLYGLEVELYKAWFKKLKEERSSTNNAFKGSSEEDQIKNFKRACFRLLSVAGLCPGLTFRNSSKIHHRFLLTEEQLHILDSQAQFLHVWGTPGSGKTLLLVERARRWIREGRHVALTVTSRRDALLHLLTCSVSGDGLDMGKVSIARCYAELLQKLDTFPSKNHVYIILDDIKDVSLSELQRYVGDGRVSGMWSASTQDLTGENKKILQKVGGTRKQLQLCLRCPKSVMALSNKVRIEGEAPQLLPPPVPVTQELGERVEVISHADHGQSQSYEKCPTCRKEASEFFSRMGVLGDNTTSDFSPSDCIVVITGSLCTSTAVTEWLQDLGLSVEEWPWQHDSTPPGQTPKAPVQDHTGKCRARLVAGLDKPAMQVVDCESFQGMERAIVILLHGDEEDEDEKKQSEQDRRARMEHHRSLWFRAASRCQKRLLVLAVTPSPVLEMLQDYSPTTTGKKQCFII